MLGLSFLIMITKREYANAYEEFFARHDIKLVVNELCRGTATDSVLSLLGLEKTEMIKYNTIIQNDSQDEIIKALMTEMRLGDTGNGIAVLVPIDSIGGEYAKKIFVGDDEIKRMEKDMNDLDFKYVLIVTVCDRGCSENVMSAAREAGARGGSVTKARGTGAEIAKILGMNITSEKDMVYIVAKKEQRNDIMHAIMEKAGAKSDTHGAVFTMPVSRVAGIKAFED